MAEYWKSTPKYWCKFCETHVRDTPFAKREHEATGRHQGAIQRSLRKLHKDSEREERHKQRARDEVARLNGIVGGAPRAAPSRPKPQVSQAQAPKQATPEDRKRQMEQLAAMGVAIPDEFRTSFAVAGDWQSTGVVREITHSDPVKDETDVKPADLSYGVRKRKVEDEEEDIDVKPRSRAWGTRLKQYDQNDQGPVDMDALMNGSRAKRQDPVDESTEGTPKIKCEDDDSNNAASTATAVESSMDTSIKPEDPPSAPIFKKRKARVAKIS